MVVTCEGGGKPFATAAATAAVNSAAPGFSGASGGPRHILRTTTVQAATATDYVGAAATVISADAAAVTTVAAATVTTAVATVAAAAAVITVATAAVVTAAAATCTATADFAARCPGAGYLYPGPGGRRCSLE